MHWSKFIGLIPLCLTLLACNGNETNKVNTYQESSKIQIDKIMEHSIKLSAEPPLLLKINLQSYDNNLGEASALITADIPPLWVGSAYDLNRTFTLVDEYNVDDSVLTIKAHDPYQVFNANLKSHYEVSHAGDQFLYPLDKHDLRINLFATYDKNNNEVQMPLIYDCRLCSFEGYNLKIHDMQTKGHVDLIVTIARNTATIMCSILLNISFLVMGVVVLIMALRIARDSESPDMGAIGFIGGLMFALPILRIDGMPDSPPLGILLDLVSLFPSEFLVIISLLIVITCWLIRGTVEHTAG